jgi:S-adenosylmethionine:tRNA ribosyltransferase-isomerase
VVAAGRRASRVVTPAPWPRPDPREERLLRIDPVAGTVCDGCLRDLPRELRRGDLVVLNDAATLPASLGGRGPAGEDIEVRLAGLAQAGDWWAVLFGAGDWRTRTEDRPPPPLLAVGDRVFLGGDLTAEVRRVDDRSPRLVSLVFDRAGAALWSALYRHGRPIQYSHVRAPLALWHVQTGYAGRPWAAELPSAGRPLTAAALLDLRRRGVGLATVTHAAGLSSTGDAALDARLPLPERFDVPARTVTAVADARARGGRVVAVGTSAVRALEGQAARNGGRLRAGTGTTDIVIGASHVLRVVDGLLTGLHEPGSSHFELLRAFAPEALLREALAHAESLGYLGHEFGDSSLVLPGEG